MALVDVTTDVAGTIWRIEVKEGQSVAKDDVIMLVESMKMEIPVSAPIAGTVVEIVLAKSAIVAEGDVVVRMERT